MLGSSRGGGLVNALHYNIVVCELELQLRYCIHFQSYTFEKYENPFTPYFYGLNSITTILL